MFLDVAVPTILLTIYLDSRQAILSLRGNAAADDTTVRRTNNLLFIAATLVLTGSLVMLANVDRDLRGSIRGTIAFMAVLNMTVHWVICHFLSRLAGRRNPIPATVLAMYRDPRRINYFDQAAYWTLVFEAMPYL
jgi:hypothetical protein